MKKFPFEQHYLEHFELQIKLLCGDSFSNENLYINHLWIDWVRICESGLLVQICKIVCESCF